MRMMGRKPLLYMLVSVGIIIFIVLLMQPLSVIHFREYISILFPRGIVALEERNLLFIIQAIMLLIIIPVYVLTFVFSWKYRSSNPQGVYDPDLVDHKGAEVLWWGIPLVFTVIIALMTWVKTYELDPYKSLADGKKPMTIQVVALQWKWLFIYPEDKVASVNFFQIPEQIPIRFEVTSDAPMNSFWLPDLGGQIYAMPGMRTVLNLIANEGGEFRGSSANISGEGFSGMHFIARAGSEEDYRKWVESAKQSDALDLSTYKELAAPSKNNPVKLYKLEDSSLFNQIIMKYMKP